MGYDQIPTYSQLLEIIVNFTVVFFVTVSSAMSSLGRNWNEAEYWITIYNETIMTSPEMLTSLLLPLHSENTFNFQQLDM